MNKMLMFCSTLFLMDHSSIRIRRWPSLVLISLILCVSIVFIHISFTYGQTNLTLQPVNSFTTGVFPSGIPPFLNFSSRINTAQLSNYSLLSGYQSNATFFNGSSIQGSINNPYYFPSESFTLSYPGFRTISFDRSNAFSSQGAYSPLLTNNNSLVPFIPNRVSNSQFYYTQNSNTFPSINTRNLGYNAFQSPFTPFGNRAQGLYPFGSINANPANWYRAELLIPYYTYTIVSVYPHDQTAYTQGLDYENGFLYEGTGIYGRSTLRKVDLLTGDILQVIDLAPQYFGEGITIYGTKIIQLTWRENVGFVYDKNTFELLDEFYYPTEGWGITHNGTSLIMSDGTPTLHFLDPVTFAETGTIDVYDADGPVAYLNELEYIQGEIYANVYLTDRIARISPTTGQVLGWIDLTGLLSPVDIVFPIDVLNGIAYDPLLDRIFVTGKYWPKLFEIDLVPL